MKDEEHLVYDEDEAIKYIKNFVPQDVKKRFTDDDINYVVDIVYEYYEDKGFINDNTNQDAMVDIDEDAIIKYVSKAIKKDNINNFTNEEISFIIQGELAYCESIGIFE